MELVWNSHTGNACCASQTKEAVAMTTPELRQICADPARLTFADIPSGLAQGPTPLETLLDLLQGGSPCALADPGITARGHQTLDRINTAAQLESDDRLDRIHCLLELLQASLPPTHLHFPKSP
jgi:hypothetical protein